VNLAPYALAPVVVGATYAAAELAVAAWYAYGHSWQAPGIDAERRAALTFDDGPDPLSTPRIAEALAAAGVRATFFVLGERAAAHAATLRALTGAGHEIGVHGWDHKTSLLRRRRTLRDGVTATVNVIADAAGRMPTLYRPPYGVLTPGAAAAAGAARLRPWLWTASALDWRSQPAAVLGRRLDRTLTPSAVVLLHDAGGTGGHRDAVANLIAALPGFLTRAQARGWTLLPLGELLAAAPQL